mgnify:CR=1 FL=1
MPAEMDLANASDVSDLLAAVASQSPEVITADMTATMFCDSSGVHALARAHELAAASGSELRLALGDSPAARIIQLIGLDQIVPVYRDVQQSLTHPRPDLTAGQAHGMTRSGRATCEIAVAQTAGDLALARLPAAPRSPSARDRVQHAKERETRRPRKPCATPSSTPALCAASLAHREQETAQFPDLRGLRLDRK